MEGGSISPEQILMVKVSAAARFRGVGFFEYVSLLRDAREKHGEGADSFELAWTLAFAQYKPPSARKAGKPRA